MGEKVSQTAAQTVGEIMAFPSGQAGRARRNHAEIKGTLVAAALIKTHACDY